jgi:glycosyltransferase involved in cell wall biosynthesis
VGALRTALLDDAVRRRLVAAGAEVARRFTWRASAQRHLEIYAAL